MSDSGNPPSPWDPPGGSGGTPPPPAGGPFGAPPPPPPGGGPFGAPPPPPGGGFGAPPHPPGSYGTPGPAGYGAPAPYAGYQSPGYQPAPPSPSNGIAIAALVLGILGLLASFIPFVNWFTSPLPLLGVGLGIAGLSKAKKINVGKGMAWGGIITGILGILITIAWTIGVVFLVNEVDSDPVDGVCNSSRELQDPDCGTGINSDPPDGVCDEDRFFEDPDC